MEHVLSLSYGKDSMACLFAIEELGWKLDRIVHADRDNGKVLNSEEAISLTCAVIKREIGLPLTKEEKQKEKQISERM